MYARVCLGVIAACFLAACSGAGVSPVPGTATNDPATLVASLTIKVPLHVDEGSHFVSPSTKSAEIDVAPRKGCTSCSSPLQADIGLTPASKNCTDTATGIACTVTIKLKAGTYQGSLTTYDGLPGCQSATVPCHVLSLKQSFPIEAASGKVTVPAIVLAGVPRFISFLDVDNATVVNRAGTLGLVGPNAKGRIELYAYDSDENIILGPGAPSFTAAAAGTFGAKVVGNVVLLSSGSTMVRVIEPLTITAHSPGCKAASAFCTLKAYTEFDPLVAVSERSNNAVGVYTSHEIQSAPYATVTSGIDAPVAVTFDGVGHLFVANSNATVTEYAAPYTSGPMATFTSVTHPASALAGAVDGHLAVADASGDSVTVYAPPATAPSASIALPAAPSAIAFDSDNRLFVGISGLVERFDPPYTGSPVPMLNGSNGIKAPVAIAFDQTGGIYVGDAGAGQVDSFVPPYVGSPKATAAYSNVTQVIVQKEAFVCGKGNLDLFGLTSLVPGVTQVISDGATQMCAVDQNGDLYDIDAAFGYISEYDPNAYTFYGAMAAGIGQPSAIAAFP